MAFVSQITDAGIAAALAAQAGAVLIDITDAIFSSDLLSQVPGDLRALTSLSNITYTAPTNRISYHVVNANTIMLRVNLAPGGSDFDFGSYALRLADGTLFAVGTWSGLQTKDSTTARYVEQNIVFSNAANTINLTILTTVDAALPEVPTAADLPAVADSAYPVYLVDTWGPNQSHALASRNLDIGAWQFYVPRNTTPNSITGANHTYAVADPQYIIMRSNAGATMVDTLPAPSVLPVGWEREIRNGDPTGVLAIKAASGSTIDTGNKIYLGPQQSAIIYSDGVNYRTRARPGRTRIAANHNLYVATTGSASNTGLTSGDPLPTIQSAWDLYQHWFDGRGNNGTINIAAGTYTSGVLATGRPLDFGAVTLSGVGSGSFINTSSGCALQLEQAGVVIASNLQVGATATDTVYTPGGYGVYAKDGSDVRLFGVIFAGCETAHMSVTGATISTFGENYEIVGPSYKHILVGNAGVFWGVDSTVTITGAPIMSVFAWVGQAGVAQVFGMTFSGAAGTGTQRYWAEFGGVINTGAAGESYLPGDVAGVLRPDGPGYYT